MGIGRLMLSASPRPAVWLLAGFAVVAGCYNSLDLGSVKCRPGHARNCPAGYECRASGAGEMGRCCPIGDLTCGALDAAATSNEAAPPFDGTAIQPVLDGPTVGQPRLDGNQIGEAGQPDQPIDTGARDQAEAAYDMPLAGGGGAGGAGGQLAETGGGGTAGQSSVDAGTDAPLASGGATGGGGIAGSGGAGGGGATSSGGIIGSGGTGTGGAATGGIAASGGAGAGGVTASGGIVGSGGTGTGGVGGGGAGAGGVDGTGGIVGSGGAGTGGVNGTGGIVGSGGTGTGGVNGTGGATGSGGATGTGGSTGCPHGEVAASEVLWLGDTWAVRPDSMTLNATTIVRDLARDAGVLGANEDYASSAAVNQTMAGLTSFYRPGFKVLLVDGGFVDLAGGLQRDAGTESIVNAVVTAFQGLLAKAAEGGTEQHIVYFLVPELPILEGRFATALAALRSPMQQACASSQVPCHFVDLQPRFAGHMTPGDYVDGSGGLPNATGAAVIGQAIWKVMQDNCIAQ